MRALFEKAVKGLTGLFWRSSPLCKACNMDSIRKNQTLIRKKTKERKTELKERRNEQDFNGRSEKKDAEEQDVNQVTFLRVTGLSKSFGKQQVLKEFTCTYLLGKITYLTGASAAARQLFHVPVRSGDLPGGKGNRGTYL